MRRALFSRSALVLALVACLGWPSSSPSAAPQRSRFLLGAYRKTIEIEGAILAACARHGVSPRLARSVCIYESGGNDSLVSSAGARGYFQVMPSTQRLMGESSNIEAGIKYLGQMVRQFGREDDAVAAYNAGPGRVLRGRRLPIETLQYVLGVGVIHTELLRDEEGLRNEASGLLLHTVAAGEDWMKISESTGISILELRLYNPYLADRPLRPGLRIAHPASPTPPGEVLGWSEEEACWTYQTLRADLYHTLASAFGVPLDRLRTDNSLWRIQAPLEGLLLQVRPGTNAQGESHVVAEGETIASIATVRGITPWDLIRENGLWDQRISPGQPLRVAGAGAGPSTPLRTSGGSQFTPDSSGDGTGPSPGLAAGEAATGGPIIHVVRRGDTLSRLARAYGTTVRAIRQTNRLRSSRLTAGQLLHIPAPAGS